MRPVFYLLLVILAVAGAYFWTMGGEKSDNSNNGSNSQGSNIEPGPYEGWKTYSNEDYGISFNAPLDWTIEKSSDSFSLKRNNKNFGYFSVSKFGDPHGSETSGPKIEETKLVISGIEATQRIFEGDGKLNDNPNQLEEKIYRDIIVDFQKDEYFYGLLVRNEIADAKFWEDVDLFIESIEVQ